MNNSEKTIPHIQQNDVEKLVRTNPPRHQKSQSHPKSSTLPQNFESKASNALASATRGPLPSKQRRPLNVLAEKQNLTPDSAK